MLIAFAGQKRSGKDTAADALVQRHGFTKIAFADGVRDAIVALDPIIGYWRGFGIVRLSDAFAEGETFESLKHTPYADEVRRLLQHMGTEVGRNTLGSETWVRAADAKATADMDWVVTDCRFANEADWVRSRGGLVIKIERPDTDSPNPTHPSEIIDFECDAVIINDGTADDLRASVLDVVENL